jgi:hypothetical protein
LEVFDLDGESFIGGFASGFLARGFHIGYGVYFTTRRLIGVDVGKNGGGALGGTMAGFIEGQLMPTLPTAENEKVISMLEGMKEFEMLKEQIRRIELHKVGLLGTGHIVIVPNSGDSVKITLRHRMAYDRLVTLTHAFGAELVSSS